MDSGLHFPQTGRPWRTPGTPYQWQKRTIVSFPSGADDRACGLSFFYFIFAHPFSREWVDWIRAGAPYPSLRVRRLFFLVHISNSFHPFNCYLHTISTLNDSAPPMASAIRHHEHDLAWVLANLAKIHNDIPRPQLCLFPDPLLPHFPASVGTTGYPTPAYQVHPSITLTQLVYL